MLPAFYCDTYDVEIDGIEYDDWFLPSRNEFIEIWRNKDSLPADYFDYAYGYLTSTEYDINQAWMVFPSSSMSQGVSKSSNFLVRPIRSF